MITEIDIAVRTKLLADLRDWLCLLSDSSSVILSLISSLDMILRNVSSNINFPPVRPLADLWTTPKFGLTNCEAYGPKCFRISALKKIISINKKLKLYI